MTVWKPDWPTALVVGIGVGSLAGSFLGRLAPRQEGIPGLIPEASQPLEQKENTNFHAVSEIEETYELRLANPEAPLYIRPKDFEIREDTLSWIIRVHSPEGKLVRSFKGVGSVPEQIVWDGRDESGVLLDNRHLANYTLAFPDSGSGKPQKQSARRVFTFLEPVLKQRSDDPRMGLAIEFRMGRLPLARPPKKWSLEILDREGKLVSRFAGSQIPPEILSWDASGHVRSVEYSYRFNVWPQGGTKIMVEGGFLDIPTEQIPSRLPTPSMNTMSLSWTHHG